MKYTNARYPDKINDLVDNDGNVNIPGGASLPAIPLGYSFEELRSGNGLAAYYLSELVVTLRLESPDSFIRIVTTDNVYLETMMYWDLSDFNVVIINHGIYMAAEGHLIYDDEGKDPTSFYLDNYREITLPEPPEPDPELDYEHKMTLKRVRGPKGWSVEVNVDGTSATVGGNNKIQLFRAPASIGQSNERAIGKDPQIYMDLGVWGQIMDFLETPETGYNYELVPGERHRIIEGQQYDLNKLGRPCIPEALGLDAYDIYFNENKNIYTFVWNGNAEAITWNGDR